ncbi:MAG: adenosine deaminase [Lewinellaceae bacterium]|nr:adenosine deaminase [Lewinellaceae bacterium]
MRYGLSFLLCILLLPLVAQHDSLLNAYLASIRDNPAELTAFFQQMPKGGDLHHHYSGSIYAESYLQAAIDSNFWVNMVTLEVSTTPAPKTSDWERFSTLEKQGLLDLYREKILRSWSVKDYPFQADLPPDQHFFATFGRFSEAKSDFGPGSLSSFAAGLLELKHRAVLENVQYIETMFTGVRCPEAVLPNRYNGILENLQQQKKSDALQDTLAILYNKIDVSSNACAAAYAGLLESLHDSLQIDDDHFTLRYQTFAVRTVPPVQVFTRLVACFMAAEASPLIVGVNIVAPENDPVSMRDYWLHMEMFRFLHHLFPNVKYAMHAGELTLGMVPPEELSWHISEAVFRAGARRIGHGVDLAYETNPYALLDSMRQRGVAIEINLSSNEFILGVKDGRHPISLYRRFDVPMVISTDDAGVLRSNLTEQYVLLATRYPEFSYTEIRELVFNSVHYSFVEDNALKASLLARLEAQFGAFEERVLR